MKTINPLHTAPQYYKYQPEEYLRMVHASQLLLIQKVTQIETVVFTLMELIAAKLTVQEKYQLLNTAFDPEPLPAIQRNIEEVQQEIEVDLQNDVYNSGL